MVSKGVITPIYLDVFHITYSVSAKGFITIILCSCCWECKYIYIYVYTIPETNSKFTPEN